MRGVGVVEGRKEEKRKRSNLASPEEPEEGGHLLGFTVVEGKEGATSAATTVDRAGASRALEGAGEGLVARWGAPRWGAELKAGEAVGLVARGSSLASWCGT